MEEDLLREFLVETYENLDKLDSDLITLEKKPESKDVLNNIFRVFHSCKGACGFLGFSKLESVAHAGENLLSSMRDGVIKLNADITGSLLSLVDIIRKMLAIIESTGKEGDIDCSFIIKNLNSFREDPKKTSAKDAGKKKDEVSPDNFEESDITSQISRFTLEEKAEFERLVGEAIDLNGAIVSTDLEEIVARCKKMKGPVKTPAIITVEDQPEKTFEDASAESQDQTAVSQRPASLEKKIEAVASDVKSNLTDTNIRVTIELLDRLMTLVGELVLVRNQFLQQVNANEDSVYVNISQRLNLITAELQEGIMKTRMQPINNIWRTFPRVVRDLSTSLNKKIRLEMEGKETELDKTVIEAIKDPLTHIVRNSVDHGIEDPKTRLAAKKTEEGCLSLCAFHESGQVNIEITDDGAGLNSDKIKRKAVQKGIINETQASSMNEREIFNLLFLPGFSTAEKVTNISGRGVGMDVVKKNIEAIGGSIDLTSIYGKGTTVKIKIPLTLAIIPALIVTCGFEKYAIPQVSLLEVVNLKTEKAAKSIEDIQGTPVYRLRGKLLPLVYLNDELKIARKTVSESAGDASVNIVVLQSAGKQFGLIVDKVNDTEEIVVKPLGKQLKNISIFAGATIRGDGKIALILDVLGIARSSGVISGKREKLLSESAVQVKKVDDNIHKILLFRTGDDGRMGIHLSKVSRLENFPLSQIENTGNLRVIQYRGNILPLLDVMSALPERRTRKRDENSDGESRKKDTVQVVVYSNNDCNVGIIVDSIIDIVEESFELQNAGCREGVIGTAVIQKRITELIDVEKIICAAGISTLKRSGV